MTSEQLITIATAFGASAAGALIGALSAHCLNLKKLRQLEKRTQHQILNHLIYVLTDARSALIEYNNLALKPYFERQDAWLNSPINLTCDFQIADFRHADLSFLSTTKHANIPLEIMLAFSNFRSLGYAISVRDKFAIDARHAISAHFEEKQQFPEEIAGQIIGRDVEVYLKKLWTAINERLIEQLSSLDLLINNVRFASAQLFPFDDPDIGKLAIKPRFTDKEQ